MFNKFIIKKYNTKFKISIFKLIQLNFDIMRIKTKFAAKSNNVCVN